MLDLSFSLAGSEFLPSSSCYTHGGSRPDQFIFSVRKYRRISCFDAKWEPSYRKTYGTISNWDQHASRAIQGRLCT
ncbi:hypothetical protein BS47DRAFT_1490503 [Hydnum rufescens UP504]|uniref:Uncharacterized protein n=1 Tax=Hydnum rufescens UP504 TaxID=1448309 RepID=A0A9P6ABQ3_9AGAM|nr:hypothetical protein BS47DRAFT_1490503 [Hydnum rufescens UP504]